MHPQPHDSREANPSIDLEAASEFARTRLGPASERLVTEPGVRALLLSRLRGGAKLDDAVLAEVQRVAKTDRDLANEFLTHFIPDLQRMGHPMISRGLRRFLDTSDLSQSVLRHVWDDFDQLVFTDRASFLALLALRLRWKTRDRLRKTRIPREMEASTAEQELDRAGEVQSPDTLAIAADERDQLTLALDRLPTRDRELLRMRWSGATVDELMIKFKLNREAVSKAVRRALARARAMLPPDSAQA